MLTYEKTIESLAYTKSVEMFVCKKIWSDKVDWRGLSTQKWLHGFLYTDNVEKECLHNVGQIVAFNEENADNNLKFELKLERHAVPLFITYRKSLSHAYSFNKTWYYIKTCVSWWFNRNNTFWEKESPFFWLTGKTMVSTTEKDVFTKERWKACLNTVDSKVLFIQRLLKCLLV